MPSNHKHESITPLREYMNHASNLYRVPKAEPEEKRFSREEELEIIKLSLQSPKYMVCLGAERERPAWEDVDPNRKKCKLCDRKWFWRKAHMRGDASLGFVRHTSYEVEQRGELVSRGEDHGKVGSPDVD